MVDSWNILKLTVFFPGKFVFAQIWAKRAQYGPKFVFFVFFLKNFVISLSWKQAKIETNVAVDIELLISGFSSYGPKYCQPIKLQDYLKCNNSRKTGIMKLTFCL